MITRALKSRRLPVLPDARPTETDVTLTSEPSRTFRCRFCSAPLNTTFVDLGMSPLCQTHIAPEQLREPEPFYPLHAYVCGTCFLVQRQEFVSPDETFGAYRYFSSYCFTGVERAPQ